MLEKITVEVVYAKQQWLKRIEIEADATVESAISASGLLEAHPTLELSTHKLGVFGQLATLDMPLHPGDRVEVYESLKIDPKDMRRLRAEKKSKQNA